MQHLARKIRLDHPTEIMGIYSLGPFARQQYSAEIMAEAIGSRAEHLGEMTLSELKVGFGELPRTFRRRAEEGTSVFVLVVAGPTINSFLRLPDVGEASSHLFTIRSPRRSAPSFITLS